MNPSQTHTLDVAQQPDEIIQGCGALQPNKGSAWSIIRSRWYAFFNHYMEQEIFINRHDTRFLFIVGMSNDIYKNQTLYEQQLSFSFFQTLFETKNRVVIDGTWTAEKLFVLSLIYSRYYAYFRCSLHYGFSTLSEKVSAGDVERLFETFLVGYEKPKFYIQKFDSLKSDDLSILIQGLSGKNMKNHPVFHKKISSDDFTQLMQTQFPFQFEDHYFCQSAIILLMTKACQNQHYAFSFVRESRTYRVNPSEYLKNISFWQRAIQLSRVGDTNYYCTTTDIVAYLEVKLSDGIEPNFLKRRSPASFQRAVSEWSDLICRSVRERFQELSWTAKEDLPDLDFVYEQVTFRCIQITNRLDMTSEARALNHCVSRYINACENGKCTIWSMQKEANGKFFRYITIEEQNGVIIQARKKNNKAIHEREQALLAEWAKRMSFKIDLHKNG